MKPSTRLGCALLAIAIAPACQVERLIGRDEMPVSENGVFTDDGRFFVAGGDTVYEVVGDATEVRPLTLLRDDECAFGGLVDRGNLLYAVCTPTVQGIGAALLHRIDPSRRGTPDVQRIPVPGVERELAQLNGMDFGPDGSLYISNSFALLSRDPAVLRVSILEEDPLAIEAETFLEASELGPGFREGGGLFPNGIQIDGDTLYLSRGAELVRMELLSNGEHGPIEPVYTTGELAVVDDFDIVADRLVIAEANLLGLFGPGAFPSKLVVTDLDGTVEREVELSFLPSSTAVRLGGFFGPRAVIVTSFFGGGLYRVSFE